MMEEKSSASSAQMEREGVSWRDSDEADGDCDGASRRHGAGIG